MTRACIFALLAFAVGCGSTRPVAAKRTEPVRAPVAVSSTLRNDIFVAGQSTSRTHDGRLRIRILLESHEDDQIALTVQTRWYDVSGLLIDETEGAPLVIPGGATKVYEAQAADERAEGYQVSVRPLSTKRKK